MDAVRLGIGALPRATVTGLVLAALVAAGGARAQSVDYGALEQMFGEPVTMSVTGKPQRASDAPADVEIITQADIRRSGATSIPDVLEFVSGLDVRRDGLAGVDVGIRGYNQASNPHLMVLLNGRQLYMVDYGRIVWAAIPVQLDQIRQIEVIKGPNAALYGFNAVGGVINIITYDPLHDRVDVATARGGTQDYRDGSVVATGRTGNAGLMMSAGGFAAKDFAPGPLPAPDQIDRRSPYNGDINADGRWLVTPTVEVFTDVSLGQTRYADQEPPGVFGTERLITQSVRAGMNADTSLGGLSVAVEHSDASVGALETSGTGMGLVEQVEYQSISLIQASDLLKLGTDHTVRAAVEFRADADDSGSLVNGRISNQIAAASLMWDWQITPRVTLTDAVRVDAMWLHFDGTPLPASGLTAAQYDRTTIVEPSLNVGLVWRATDDDTVRLSLARGVQLPTLLQYALETRVTTVPPRIFLGTPNLNPAIVWNAELDYDRNLAVIGSVLRTAVFVQRTDDVLAWPFGAPLAGTIHGAQVIYSANVGSTGAAGTELGLKGHAASGFRWNASYSFVATAGHTVLNQGPAPTSIVDYDHSTPQHVLIGGLGWTGGKWELDWLARWQSSYLDYRMNAQRTALFPEDIDNYVTMTARAGYRVTDRVEVSLTVQQLNQADLVETAGPPVERRIIASVSVRL